MSLRKWTPLLWKVCWLGRRWNGFSFGNCWFWYCWFWFLLWQGWYSSRNLKEKEHLYANSVQQFLGGTITSIGVYPTDTGDPCNDLLPVQYFKVIYTFLGRVDPSPCSWGHGTVRWIHVRVHLQQYRTVYCRVHLQQYSTVYCRVHLQQYRKVYCRVHLQQYSTVYCRVHLQQYSSVYCRVHLQQYNTVYCRVHLQQYSTVQCTAGYTFNSTIQCTAEYIFNSTVQCTLSYIIIFFIAHRLIRQYQPVQKSKLCSDWLKSYSSLDFDQSEPFRIESSTVLWFCRYTVHFTLISVIYTLKSMFSVYCTQYKDTSLVYLQSTYTVLCLVYLQNMYSVQCTVLYVP